MDLFTASLESVSEGDLSSFLGLGLPVEQRPSEGQRLDFKKEIPADLARHVAAFANTYGGIFLIGVGPARVAGREEKNIPGSLIGIPATEAKLRVTHMIRDSVYPVPVFQVSQCLLKRDPSRTVVIIRVAAGDHPPYMYLKKREIPIRRGDGSDNASPFDLESLLARRTSDAAEKRAARVHDILIRQRYPDQLQQYPSPEPSRARNYQTISIIPWDFSPVNLDRNLERRIEKRIQDTYVRDLTADLAAVSLQKSVAARWVEFERADFAKLVHRKWRMNHDGVIQFSSAIPYNGPELIGNLFLDFFSTLKLGELILSEFEVFGNVDFRSEISCIDSEVAMKLPVAHAGAPLGDPDVMSGVRVRTPKPVQGRNSWTYHATALFGQLGQPVELAALVFSEHLRQVWQCEFDFDQLQLQLNLFWKNEFVRNLPVEIGAAQEAKPL